MCFVVVGAGKKAQGLTHDEAVTIAGVKASGGWRDDGMAVWLTWFTSNTGLATACHSGLPLQSTTFER